MYPSPIIKDVTYTVDSLKVHLIAREDELQRFLFIPSIVIVKFLFID